MTCPPATVVVLSLLALALVPSAVGQGTGVHSSDGLDGGKLQPARRDPVRVEGARLQPASGLKPAAIDKLSAALVRDGLTPGKVRGAVSSLPPSKLGEVFYGVARELERQEGEVTHMAVGYYMAALTDPGGDRYKDAKRRLQEILFDADLPHEQAVGLYNGGVETFSKLCASEVGIPSDGAENGLRDLWIIRQAYRARRGG